jgi:hypothetical protein
VPPSQPNVGFFKGRPRLRFFRATPGTDLLANRLAVISLYPHTGTAVFFGEGYGIEHSSELTDVMSVIPGDDQ